MKLPAKFAFVFLFVFQGLLCSGFADTVESQANFLEIKIDKISIDSARLTRVSEHLAKSISQLSIALETLATHDSVLKPEERQSLMEATNSVNEASRALTELAKQLPSLADQISETLPETIKNTQHSIGQISNAVEKANRTLTELTTSFPETVVHGENFVDRMLDSIFQKITFYSIVILLLFFIGLSGIAYYGYRRIFQPLLAVVNQFQLLPEQMAEISLQNKQTSENLVSLQQVQNSVETTIKPSPIESD